MLPLNESDSFPYFFVIVFGSWRILFILKLYGSTFLLLKKYNEINLNYMKVAELIIQKYLENALKIRQLTITNHSLSHMSKHN